MNDNCTFNRRVEVERAHIFEPGPTKLSKPSSKASKLVLSFSSLGSRLGLGLPAGAKTRTGATVRAECSQSEGIIVSNSN